jgi:hypothetical protein
MEILLAMLTHEYAMVIYGVLLWQIQQQFTKRIPLRERFNYIGRSMIWGGMIVVFDDEIADWLLDSFEVDLYHYDENDEAIGISWYFYMGVGFLIDIVRHKITKQ